jgi:membrane protein DedA with SNARE-associated domain
MSLWRFMVFDIIGLCVSLPLYFWLGYVFADNITIVREQVATTTWAIALALAAVLLVVAIVVYVRRSRAAGGEAASGAGDEGAP